MDEREIALRAAGAKAFTGILAVEITDHSALDADKMMARFKVGVKSEMFFA
ncbi:MAG: hypothetical protein M1485_02900 [Chloroflexi bacterium]|nr:hypothetical protein [Chloroflexota bacterium]